MNKWVAPITSMLMWAAGTALVVITLSGEVRAQALWISAAALIVNLVAIFFEVIGDDDDA
jgi:steroid 5-alpha reductase family enzyme